ncbi:nephrin-like [Argiope bruennichi]|uniref:nephrin-like n=1 Tax=Argiope bruennichi TaxID=94029 RepID=UPI002494CA90|nr:nephrin-like [Argiope bruennichi]
MMRFKSLLHIVIIYLVVLFKITLAESIFSVEGQVAILPCSAASSSFRPNVKTTLLRWFHNHYPKPAYTLDVRYTEQMTANLIWSDTGARHFPSSDYEGRLYLEVSSEIPALRIDPVQFDDNGLYTCQVDFKFNRSVSSSVDLHVIVPPKGVVIRDQEDRKVEGVIGPFNLGETLIITCEALGGHPIPTLSWSGTFDNSSAAYQLNTTNTTSSLIIPLLKRSDQWTHFTCTAWNSPLTAPKSITVTIEINLPPLDVKMDKNFKEPLVAGDRVTFVCQSFGSHPRAHIRWCLDGETMPSKDVVTDNGNITTSYYQRLINSHDDGKDLECIATNSNIPNFILKQTYTMNVHYKPEVNVSIQEDPSILIAEGKDIVISCSIRSNPEISEVDWTFENSKISDSSHVRIKDNNLIIRDAKKSDAGNYSCKAKNSEGYSSALIHVNVGYTPVCQGLEISAKHSDEHNKDSTNVTCNLSANPANVTFYWMTRNSSSNHTWTTHRDSYTLVKLNESVIELFCWGRNEVGLQNSACSWTYEGQMNASHDTDVIFIVSFVAILCFVIFLISCRKIFQRKQKDSVIENKEVIGLKDGVCSQMLNNCVKSTSTSPEVECLTNLLPPEHSNATTKSRYVSTNQRELKLELREANRETRLLLKREKNDIPRRIRSSQF